jgi:hypothetical protein
MEGEWSSETFRLCRMVVHFMLDQRKPLGFLTLIKGSAIKKEVRERVRGDGAIRRSLRSSYQFITQEIQLLC